MSVIVYQPHRYYRYTMGIHDSLRCDQHNAIARSIW
jgi:hypothetical protein